VGEMTVKSNNGSLNYHAFIYRAGKMKDLNKLIPQNSGWVLKQATGINDSGQIVGWGMLHKQIHAFLLSPSK